MFRPTGSGVLMWCYHTARGESGLIYDVYYCDILLIKQLLPDICQAAGDFCFPLPNSVVDASTVNAFKARLDKFWSHQAVKFDFTAVLTGTGNRSEELKK